MRRPPFTVRQLLAWADAHHERAGQWPQPVLSGHYHHHRGLLLSFWVPRRIRLPKLAWASAADAFE
jgi:hypothetical protein